MTMTKEIKLPRKLSDEPRAPMARRRSHQDVIENLDRWANSPGLQPPTSPDSNGLRHSESVLRPRQQQPQH